MTDLKEDVHLLLHLNEVQLPSLEARKFAYSERLAESVASDSFFDDFSLDSDERFWVNEIASYFETLGMLFRRDIVERELVLEWGAPALYWNKVGPILVKSREVFEIENLWEDFEAMATEQAG